MSSYAAHGRDAEWRAARSTATTLELKASYRCCRWPVRESCRETWEPPSPFHSRDPTKFVRSAVAVRRSFLSFTVSLHLSLSHVENLREIAVDARAITCPPVLRSFFDENNCIYGYSLRILSTSFSRDVCEWYVSCVLVVLPVWHCSSFSEGGKEWQAELTSSIANKVRLFKWYYITFINLKW